MDGTTMEKLKMDNIKDMAISVLKVGCDKINFQILEMVMASSKGITTNEIRKKFNLSCMPANRRINQLVKVGLLKRPGRLCIQKVDFTEKFMKEIKGMEKIIRKNTKIKSIHVWK